MSEGEGADWTPASGVPISGFEVGSGKFVGVDEDGAVTAPIVTLSLMVEGEPQQYTLPAWGAKQLAGTLNQAADDSAGRFFAPKEMAELDKHKQHERRWRITLIIAAVLFVITFAVLDGFTESTTYIHHGGTLAGIIGGFDTVARLVGLVVLYIMVVQLLRRRINRRGPKPPKPPKLSPDAPPEESIP